MNQPSTDLDSVPVMYAWVVIIRSLLNGGISTFTQKYYLKNV